MSEPRLRIGIVGFGYSGLMVLANMLRHATAPFECYIIDELANGQGVAYSTANPDHLLNVRAGGMSAWADAPNDLVQWLASDAGKYAAATRKLRGDYGAEDFIPRALYGDYLSAIWHDTQQQTSRKQCHIHLVPTRATAIRHGDVSAILTLRGDAIAVDRIVLAVGHEVRKVLPHVKSQRIVQDPWNAAAFAQAALWAAPVMIMGAGLTAIDTVFTLRHAGYAGEILMTSRRGLMPHAHDAPPKAFAFEPEEVAAQNSLLGIMSLLRKHINALGQWRPVVDALRPYTQAIWQRMPLRDQQRFLRMLMPLWNIHRHRMAPEIADRIHNEIMRGSVQLIAGKGLQVSENLSGELTVNVTLARGARRYHPSRIINCTGLSLGITRSENPLLRQLVAEGLIEEHITGLGLAADTQYRAWGGLYPKLYVMGSLLTGQLLESTAVPELREQAAQIAANLI